VKRYLLPFAFARMRGVASRRQDACPAAMRRVTSAMRMKIIQQWRRSEKEARAVSSGRSRAKRAAASVYPYIREKGQCA